MKNRTLTVGVALFPDGWEAIPDEDHETLRDLHETIRKELGSVNLLTLKRALLDKVASMLDEPLIGVLAGAWGKYSEILKYSDRKAYPPDDTFLVSLAEHTISVEYRPCIQVFINNVRRGSFEFVVTLGIMVMAFQLEIQDARIRRVRTGTLKGIGEVALEGERIYRKEFQPIDLPGVIDLGEGIAIGA